jgi:hypothetical protein
MFIRMVLELQLQIAVPEGAGAFRAAEKLGIGLSLERARL